MSVNKLAVLKEFLSLKPEVMLRRFERLRYSSANKPKDYFWNLNEYRFDCFHPLTPIFLRNYEDSVPQDKFLLCIDGSFDIYHLLQRIDHRSFGAILILNKSLAPIVPKHWLEKVIFFDLSLNDSDLTSREKLLIHGVANRTSMDEQPVLSRLMDEAYLHKVCCLEAGWDRFSENEHFSFLPEFYSLLLKKNVDFIDFKMMNKLSNFSEYCFFDFDPGLITSTYNFVGDKLLSLGALPHQLQKRDKAQTPLFSYPLSFFHSMNFFEGEDIESSNLLDEVDELRLFLQDDYEASIISFFKENFSPRYYS